MLRVEAAYAGFCVYEQACWVAVLFWAFAAGGPPLAGIVAVAQLVPAALLAPIGGMIGDRMPRDRALSLIYLMQAVAMGTMAIALVGGNRGRGSCRLSGALRGRCRIGAGRRGIGARGRIRGRLGLG